MKRKIITLSLILAILSFIGIGLTYAFEQAKTEKLENTFIKLKDTNIEVHETFDGTTKENVYITINSDVSVYIRAKLVFNYLDEDGNIVSKKPIKDEDYVLTINENWIYKDGYYYLDDSLLNENTPVLINKLESLKDEYKLSLDILIQTTNIQDYFY